MIITQTGAIGQSYDNFLRVPDGSLTCILKKKFIILAGFYHRNLMTTQKPDWSEKKILIAEDEFMGKKFLEKLLLSRRATLQFANNGEEAVRAVKNEHFDMVLMDLKMPVKSGFDATMEIKEMQPELPVIAQTGLAFPADEERARACGCDDLVTKPIHKNELIEKMIRFMGS